MHILGSRVDNSGSYEVEITFYAGGNTNPRIEICYGATPGKASTGGIKAIDAAAGTIAGINYVDFSNTLFTFTNIF